MDVETSGTHHAQSRVIEIAILRIEEGTCVETFRTTLNPQSTVPAWITDLTGITNKEVRESPRFDEIADDIERLLRDAIFVAHNVAFDYGFVEREFARIGREFHAHRLCTARLSRALFPHFRRHSLAHLIERHGLLAFARHRAFDDAYALWQFLQLCGTTHGRFGTAFDTLVNQPPRRLFLSDDGDTIIR